MDEADFDKQLEGTTKLITSLNINQEPTLSKPVESGTNGVNGDKAKYNKLIEKAKELGRQGQLERALGLFEKAYKIHNGEKLWRKIEKLKEAIERYKELEEEEDEEEEEDDNGMREVGDGFYLSAEIYRALYPYQLEGIRWFWRLHQQGEGGILGDDMGLGKTIQVVSFLAGMFDAGLIKSALIVMPVSLLSNWEKEFNKWAPGIRVLLYHGSNKNERLRNLEKIQRRRGVCLTTYGLIQTSFESLGTTSSGSTFMWDYIILDEGHKIKNPTKTSKNVREIPAKSHFILTGTPVQNNLREMWALFDFACEGKLLGTSRTFKQQYENPIVRARERDASSYEKRMGMEMSESLRKLIEPHFLRRTKAMVLENKKKATEHVDGPDEADKENRPENAVRMPESLTRKNDLIIWLYMSDTQQKIYSEFLGLERVKELLMSTRSPLAELNVLKKVCDHPRLLSTLACEQLGLDEEDRLVELDSAADNDERSFANEPKGLGPSDRMLTQESGKMVFLVALLKNLKCEGHRCLVFSQSRKMLDIIQRVITHMGHKVLRIDGTVTKVAERQRLINTFQTDPSYSCFLLTTQVGGVGITLTSADRVVIFDPSWNPATDAQAVDRVYRIGQKKTVIIYRLITCGTLEEKIYRKQIFKDALMKQTTGVSKNPFRYFTNQELRDLFTLDDPYTSKTQMQLEQMHARHRKTDDQLDKHIEFIHTLNIFGISDHDLMYSQEEVDTPDELNTNSDNDAIQARVLHAQNLMAAEARLSGQIRPGGAYPPAGIPPGVMALPQGLRHSLPVDENNMSARQKIQARIDSERFIIPTNQDSKRFQPSQIVKAPLPMPVVPSPIVVDLCSPSPAKTSTTPSPMPSPMPSPNGIALDLCTPDHEHSSPHPSPVEISHAVDEHQEEGLGQTPSPAPNRKAVDLCTPDPEQNSPYQSPVEINHLPSLSEILAQEEQPQDEGLEQTPAQSSSHQPPVEIGHFSFTELQAQNEKPQGEGLEEEFSSLHIENHSTNSVRESSSPECESPLNVSLENQTLEESCHVLDEDISRDQHEPHQCPTGQHVSANVNIQKCACLVSEEEQARYDSYINNGRRFEHKGQTKEAIAQYLNALELQNSDLKLHMKVLQLAQGFD